MKTTFVTDPSRYRESIIAPFPPLNQSHSSNTEQTSSLTLRPLLARIFSPPLVRTPTPVENEPSNISIDQSSHSLIVSKD